MRRSMIQAPSTSSTTTTASAAKFCCMRRRSSAASAADRLGAAALAASAAGGSTGRTTGRRDGGRRKGMTVMPTRPKGRCDVAILPDDRLALKLSAMTFLDRLRVAWACEECRFYRRAALALGVLAACAWLVL